MAINLTSKAYPRLAERFQSLSCTEGLFTARYDWTGVGTVKVFSVDTLPLQNYDKTETTASRFGALTELGETVQEMTVSQDKSFNGAIDKGNNTAQLMVRAASSVLRRQTDEVIIPTVDAYRLEVMSRDAGLVYAPTATFTKSNILEHLMTANAKMSNERVPRTERVTFIGESLAIQARLAEQVMGLETVGEQALVSGVCGRLDGNQLRVVPDSYLPAGVAFMIVRRGCACAPKKIETYRILEDHPDIDGHVVQGRLLHDCFVLDSQAAGVLTCAQGVTAANGGGATYVRVVNPAQGTNPASEGWYTQEGFQFTATADTSVGADKVYYIKK